MASNLGANVLKDFYKATEPTKKLLDASKDSHVLETVIANGEVEGSVVVDKSLVKKLESEEKVVVYVPYQQESALMYGNKRRKKDSLNRFESLF